MPAAPVAPPPAPAKEPPVTQPGPVTSTDATSFEAEFGELEALDDKPKPVAKPAEKAKETPKVETPKPTDKPKSDTTKAPEKPAEVEPKTIPEVRRAYDAKKREIRETWEPKVKALESELATLKATAGNGHAEEFKSLTDKFTASQKRVEELEGEMRFVNYRKSKEFADKYEQPYNEAWGKAIAELEELSVRVRTGVDDVGEPTYGERKATSDDLLMLANLKLGEARKLAKEMFGDNADDMMAHRRKIRDLSDAQTKALAEAEKSAKDHDESKTLQSRQALEQTGKLWTAANKQLSEKYPKWFAPVEGDDEGNALLEKGFAAADRLFNQTPETAPKTPQEAVALHALLRNKAANHDRLALKNKQLSARVTELEEKLRAFEESEPPAGGGAAPGAAGGTDWKGEADAEIDALNVD